MDTTIPDIFAFDAALLEERDYWVGRLARGRGPSNLIAEHQRPAFYPADRDAFEFAPPEDALRLLTALAGGSPFLTYTALVAALGVCLQRYTGGEGVVIGSPALKEHGRPNALVVAFDLDERASFRDLLLKVRETLLESYERQSYPFTHLVRALGLEQSGQRCPLFDVALAYTDIHGELPDGGNDLTITFEGEAGRLRGRVDYNKALFGGPQIERFVEHLFNVLGRGIENREGPLRDIQLLSEAERARLLYGWNETALDYPRDLCVHQLFERQAALTPGATALVHGDAALTYAELDERADRLALHLRSLGVGPDLVVGLCVARSVEAVVGLLGILKAGAAYLPLDPEYPPDRLSFMLEDAAVPVLLTQESLVDELPSYWGQAICLDADWDEIAATGAAAGEGAAVSPGHLAYCIYTSGSTGRPKGVMVEHRGLCSVVAAQIKAFGVVAEDRVLQFASLSFDASVSEIFTTLAAGAALVGADAESLLPGPGLLRLLREQSVTVVTLPPSVSASLPAEDLPALRTVIAAGESCPADVAARWGAGRRFLNAYGPTEATICVTVHEHAGADGRPPIGRPIGNARVYLLDGDMNPVPVGVPGELWAGGLGVARGYLRRPGLTAERFAPDPFSAEPGARLYRTGDLARYLEDGSVEYLGRVDHQVKVRGFRIEPGEIEAALDQHPAVRQCAVVARDETGAGNRLVAYLVGGEGGAPNVGELRGFLSGLLPDYMLPSVFVVLDELPLNANGKVDRRALPAPDASRPELAEAFTAPANPVEEALAQIWSEVLGVAEVGVHDNFFELGGDSILSIQIVARANQGGLSLQPPQLFEHQTIAQLALVVGTAAPVQAEQGEVVGAVPLTPIQHWFFERRLSTPHHFNQSVLLEARQPLDAAALGGAVSHLLRHHDALRMRFAPDEDGTWRQYNAPFVGSEDAFRVFDLKALPVADQPAEIEREAARLQEEFDLSSGPLMRAAYFHCGPSAPARLLLVAHHLVVDGVSWRVIMEDLQTLYAQLSGGQVVELPAKTTPFKRWAERLTDYARSEGLTKESDYWLGLAREVKGAARLPRDGDGANTLESARTVTAALTAEETRALLQRVPEAYRTQINDALLSTLADALANWSGGRRILVQLEGHGREAVFDDADVTRTVGWFTSRYPVMLERRGGPGETLKWMKEMLRAVPGRGVGYGVLRYMGEDASVRAELGGLDAAAEVGFNYLGQFDQVLQESSPFAPAKESGGRTYGLGGEREHVLEINGSIVGGRLLMTWTYSENLHERETVERLSESYMAALRALTQHCASPEAGGYTPSDFPLAGLDQQELDRLLDGGRGVEDVYPLTPLQQGLLFHTLYAPDSGVYFTQLVCTLHADLDAVAFRHAWQQTLDHYPVLRTAFAWAGVEEPLQIVHRRVTLPWEEEDWREAAPAEREARLATYVAENQRRGFDLSTAPLTRCALFRAEDAVYQVVWSFHHLLLDGWGLAIVVGEVFAAYDAICRGHDLLVKPSRPFRDYVAWLKQQDLPEEEFWRRTLAGFTAPVSLGVERAPGGADGEGDYGTLRVRLPKQTTAALQALAQAHQLTLNTVLQGAWALLLSRYSGEEDVVFGATVSGRPAALPGVESIVGIFINTIPARVVVEPGARLVPWLREIQAQQVEARQYEHSPLAQIQAWSDVPRGRPLFENVLVFENYPVDSAMKNAGGSSLVVGSVRAVEKMNYPLSLTVMPAEELSLRLSYDERRYGAATIGRMMGHLRTLLEEMAARPDARLHELGTLTAPERRQLIHEFNETAADYPRDLLIGELFERQAARTPGAVAVVSGGGSLTYAELNARANQLANHLRALGVGPEVAVGLCVERSIEMVVGLVGILKAGGAYVPLDPAYPTDRLAFMIEDAAVSVLLTQERLEAELPAHWGHTLFLDSEWEAVVAAESEANFGPTCAPENAAYVIYTSGSTGRPKGVVVSHRNLVHSTAARFRYYREPVGNFLLIPSFAFDSSVAVIFWTLTSGGALTLPREGGQRDPRHLSELIRRDGVTHLLCLPSLYDMLLAQSRGAELDSLTTVIVAGEAFPKELVGRHFARATRAEMFNEYGPTEGTVWSSAHRFDSPGAAVPIGRPVPNVRLYVLDRAGQVAPVGVAGELHVAGEGVARGYLARRALTAERFIPDPFSSEPGGRLYRTGDLARYLEDGTVEYLGRTDNQVKVRGYRIELGEVENALAQAAAVEGCVVVAREDVPGERRLVAYLVAGDGGAPPPPQLRSQLAERLPEYMIPSAFVVLDELPLNANGKLDRGRLPAPEATRDGVSAGFAAPSTPVEEALAEIWGQVLGQERVGVDDNFFELGGDSIRSVQIMVKAQERGIGLTLPQVFEHPTVRGLAPHVRMLGDAEADAPESGPFGLLSEEDLRALPAGLADAYPLTMMQAGMLFHSELSPETAIYHSIITFHLRAPFDAAALKGAAQRMAARHPVLRTSFDLTSCREPLQLVHEDADVPVEVFDLRGLAADDQQAEIARWLKEEELRHFDWSRPPLFRLTAHRRTDETLQFTFTAHHTIIDGWSDALFLTELFRHYLALADRRQAPDEPPPAALFRHYVALERQALASAECVQFWSRKLSDRTATQLPHRDDAPGSGDGPRFERLRPPVPPEVARGLKGLARAAGVPMKSVLLAAHLRVLSLLGGQRDVLTGVVWNGRPESPDSDRLIGLFLNTLPFRLRLAGGSWADLVCRTFEAEREMLPYRRYPLGRLQQLAGGEHLFDTCFNFTHFHIYDSFESFDQLDVLSVHSVVQTNFTLMANFNINTAGGGVDVDLGFDLRRLSREQCEAIAGYYARTLEAMAADSSAPVEGDALLPEAELRRLLVEWNDTREEFPLDLSFQELFEQQVARTPDAVAVSGGAGRLTYRGLDDAAERAARLLAAEGCGAESVVAVLAERGVGLLVMMLAVFKAGGTYLPLDPLHPPERLRQVVEQSGAALVLVAPEHAGAPAGAVEGARARVLSISELMAGGGPAPAAAARRRVEPRQAAYVIYTSGSTGVPKGAVVEHRGMLNHLLAKVKDLRLTGADTVAQTAPQSFDISVWQFLAPLLVGGRVHVVEGDAAKDPRQLSKEVESEAVTILEVVPSLLSVMLSEAASAPRMDALRWLLVTGEALPPELCRGWLGLYPEVPLLNAYGPTECSDDVTHHLIARPPAQDAALTPIGRPVANTQIYILDEALWPVPAGVLGAIYVGGAGVGRGYLHDPRRTAEVFLPDPFSAGPGARMYRTGDLGRHLPGGEIEFAGRVDHQVKVHGYRIELGEIESALAGHESVREAVVLAREDAGADKRLVAYLTPRAGAEVGAGELRDYARKKLPEYMIPSAFVVLDELPLNANGKLDRRALPAPEADGAGARAYEPPRTLAEQAVAEVWADALGLERVGRDDDFFELGGHSLLAIIIISRLREVFQTDIPLRIIFAGRPTVEGLARAIEIYQIAQADEQEVAALLEEVNRLSEGEARSLLADDAEPT
ncbi:MAG TPA: amino acid adenylation domain-containing protein [Pyrinomonadaceae bacterium]|nr:amino acid adenylation domain-containing protein [Pyrinomonadaceae bacterium]